MTRKNRPTKVARARAHAKYPRVSLVIPIKDEAANLPHVLPNLPSTIDEILIVDGNSRDNSIEVALALRPDAKILHQTGKGKGNALRCGFENATGDYIIQIDADGSMDPDEIQRYIDALDEGYDFVKGSRTMPGGGSEDLTRLRDFGNKVFTGSINLIFGTNYSDSCYGFIGLRRTAVKKLGLKSEGFNIETEMIIHAKTRGLRVREVPSIEYCRINGDSHLNTFRDGLKISQTILRIFFESRAIKLATARTKGKY